MKIKLFFITFLVSISAFSQEKKIKIYPFKSAIIEYKYEASFGGTHTKYIDDYGYKQTDIIRRELNFGGNTEKEYETVILIGDKAYTINPQDNTIAIGRNATYNYYLQNQDKECTEVSEAIRRVANGYKHSGEKEFLGMDCKVWKSGKSTMLTWNGLELKSEINFMIMMVEKATKIKVNKKIPKGIFEIPDGLKYISSDVYQGFSGLELNFVDNDTTKNESQNIIDIDFDTRSLGATNNFSYFLEDGTPVVSEGINDYNKIDARLIKSQQQVMTSAEIELPVYRSLIFETNDSFFGKMQIKSIDNDCTLRFIVFDHDGLIKSFSNGSSAPLTEDFDFNLSKENKLKIIPKGKAKCFVLGQ